VGTKLDAMRIERLLTALAAGNTRRSSALFAGITPRAVEKRAKRDAKFRDMLRDAEEKAVLRNVSLILNAAKTSWQAAAWWLERRYPQDWGRQLTFMGTGPGGAIPVEATVHFVLPVNNRDPIVVKPLPRRLLGLEDGKAPDVPGNGDGAV
jgi:hypothetical protein